MQPHFDSRDLKALPRRITFIMVSTLFFAQWFEIGDITVIISQCDSSLDIHSE